MGRIVSTYILPHPPVLVPEVGKGDENGALITLNAIKRAAREIRVDSPTTIILTTPHGPVFQDFIYISTTPRLSGNLGRFGAQNTRFDFENNTELVNRLIEIANSEDINCGGLDDELAKKLRVSRELDHGATVPLYFVNKEFKGFKLVHISTAGLPLRELYKFGSCISKAVNQSDEKVVFIASGDLSHRLSEASPYGFNKRGPEFDEFFVNCIREVKPEKLLSLDEGFSESAGECGSRSFIMMFGAMDGYRIKSEVYSYEGPFGIGYSVARFEPEMENSDRNVDPYVLLARKTLETYVKERRAISIPDNLPEEMMNKRAGAFVSLKKFGQLRGCIGTIAPVRRNIAEEIIYNAISSGTQDPRFDPVKEDELGSLVYSVDILNDPEPIDSMNELDVVRYGVIVRSGRRSGLLLPNLEGVDTPEKQVTIALQKAGIKPGEKYSMERFEVIRHTAAKLQVVSIQ